MNERTKNLVCLLLTDPDPDVRRRVAEDLAAYNDQNVLTVLSIALEDENKGVEDAVARSLLNIGGVAASLAVVHHIANENIISRNLAAKLLIKLGEASVTALIPYLRNVNKDIRKLAVDILGEIRSKEPVYYLLPLLRDPDPNVLVAAFEALGNIGSSEAVDPIKSTVEQYPFARIVAIEALGKIGGNSVRIYLEHKFKEAIDTVNTDGIYLFALLDAMGIVGNNDTLKVLLENYDKIEKPLRDVLLHETVQITERCDLEYQYENKVHDDLLHALHNDNPHIQLSAAKGLVQFKDTVVTRALLLSLGISEDMDWVIIAQMSGRYRAFQIAVECLEEGVSRGEVQIIMLLGKLSFEFIHSFKSLYECPIEISELERAFALAVEAWHEVNQEDREIITDTLFRLDCEHAVTFLSTAMDELDPWSCARMIDQLIAIPSYRALDCIARFVNNENEMVREAAVSALQSANYKVKAGTGNKSLNHRID